MRARSRPDIPLAAASAVPSIDKSLEGLVLGENVTDGLLRRRRRTTCSPEPVKMCLVQLEAQVKSLTAHVLSAVRAVGLMTDCIHSLETRVDLLECHQNIGATTFGRDNSIGSGLITPRRTSVRTSLRSIHSAPIRRGNSVSTRAGTLSAENSVASSVAPPPLEPASSEVLGILHERLQDVYSQLFQENKADVEPEVCRQRDGAIEGKPTTDSVAEVLPIPAVETVPPSVLSPVLEERTSAESTPTIPTAPVVATSVKSLPDEVKKKRVPLSQAAAPRLSARPISRPLWRQHPYSASLITIGTGTAGVTPKGYSCPNNGCVGETAIIDDPVLCNKECTVASETAQHLAVPSAAGCITGNAREGSIQIADHKTDTHKSTVNDLGVWKSFAERSPR